jgi:hypothetical protein
MITEARLSQQTNFLSRKELLWPLCFLAFGFFFITLHQSDYFRAIPGNMGDARFNNVILEHLFLWFSGVEPSLWSPGFFFPYPGTLSFSDNHFGTGAVYILMRLLGLDPEQAFIGWYTVAAPLNYLCCYYALRKLGLSAKGGAVGAFIFAFAFNVAARHGHAQLAYRFAIPLAMLAWHRLVEQGHIKKLALVFFWLTVQFYCSIYLGYFLLLLLIATFVAQLLICRLLPSSQNPFRALWACAKSLKSSTSISSILLMAGCVVALLVLLYPYMHYSRLYGFHRDYPEIEGMLPRPTSYILADASYLWGRFATHITGIPVRWEHQMFFGLATCVLGTIGVIRRPSALNLSALIALFLLIALTLDIRGHSLYAFVYQLPLANAVRAITRIGLVMIFPVAVLAGSGVDWLTSPSLKGQFKKRLVAMLLIAFALVEYTAYYTESLPLKDLRERYAALMSHVPPHLADDAIIYVPLKQDEPYYFTELDGVRLAQTLHRNTVNGYSGNAPTGFNDSSTDPCAMVDNRLTGYASFAKRDFADYRALADRVVVIGRGAPCAVLALMPQHTHFHGRLPDALVKEVVLSIESVSIQDGSLATRFVIKNHSDSALPSKSDDGHDIRYSWRMVPVGSTPGIYDGWDPRKDLTADVPAGGTRSVDLPIDAPRKEGQYRLEASLVQENMFFFHGAGMPIAKSNQIIEVKHDGSIRIVE